MPREDSERPQNPLKWPLSAPLCPTAQSANWEVHDCVACPAINAIVPCRRQQERLQMTARTISHALPVDKSLLPSPVLSRLESQEAKGKQRQPEEERDGSIGDVAGQRAVKKHVPARPHEIREGKRLSDHGKGPREDGSWIQGLRQDHEGPRDIGGNGPLE